jgi:hypothetical protein
VDFDPNSPGFQRQLRDLQRERDSLSNALATVSERITWMEEGQRLFGEQSVSENGARPILRVAIERVIRESPPTRDWEPKEVLTALETRNWAPSGRNQLQVVRQNLRNLVDAGTLQLVLRTGKRPRYRLNVKEAPVF